MSEDFILNRKRDFNELLNGTGRFVKLEIGDYIGLLLKLYLPVGLLLLAADFFLAPRMIYGNDNFLVNVIILIIDTIYVVALNYGFIKEIILGNDPTAGNVWKRLPELMPKLLLLLLFFAIVGVLCFVVIVLLGYLISPSMSVLLIPAILCAMIFGIRIALVFPVINSEESSLFDAIGRSWKLTKGYWWQTFGGVFIVGLVGFGLTFASTLVNYWIIQQLFTDFSGNNLLMYQLYMVLFDLIARVFSLFTQFFTHSFLTLQYFNLVERKEAPELMARIGEIGWSPEQNNQLSL